MNKGRDMAELKSIEAAKHVKVTLQITEKERKEWKQYALVHDMTLTEAIKKAMIEMMSKESS